MSVFSIVVLFLPLLVGCGEKLAATLGETDDRKTGVGDPPTTESKTGDAKTPTGPALTVDFSTEDKLSGGTKDAGNAIAVQSDGKIVVAGHVTVGTSQDALISRFLPGGALDTSFGTDGHIRYAVTAFHDTVEAVAIQPDGKILVAGSSHKTANASSAQDWYVARFTTSGNLDVTFNASGVLKKSILSDGVPLSMALTSTHIYVAGWAKNTNHHGVILKLQLSDGLIDTTFDVDGVKTYYTGTHTRFSKILVDPNGTMTVAGRRHSGTGWNAFVGQLKPDGTFNTGVFGGAAGYLVTGNAWEENLWDLVVLPDGKFLAFGTTDENNISHAYLSRINANGVADASWTNHNFKMIEGANTHTIGRTLLANPDGTKYYISGHVFRGTVQAPLSGTRDSFFAAIDSNGIVTDKRIFNFWPDQANYDDTFLGMALCENGKQICFSGSSSPDNVNAYLRLTGMWL